MAKISGPWTMTGIIGIALIPVAALGGGFLLGYWAGGKPAPVESQPSVVPPAASAPASPRPAAAPAPPAPGPAAPAPAASAPAAPAPAASPVPKVTAPAVEAPRPKVVAAPPAPLQPVAPAPVPAKRPRIEPAPTVPVKPRTAPTGPSAADIEACTRHATARLEGQEASGEDAQDRKEDGSFRDAYLSCLQARGFKRPGGND